MARADVVPSDRSRATVSVFFTSNTSGNGPGF